MLRPGISRLWKGNFSPDPTFLARAWAAIAATAAESNVGVVLGTERLVGEALLISALVINRDGSVAGFQDKVQLDPSEDETYTPGVERHIFQAGPLKFGIAICHEGFRYPETVRWAAQRGAHIVFHPHLSEAEGDSYPAATQIRRTHFTKKRFCAVPPKIHAFSLPPTARAKDHRRPRPWRSRTELF